MAITNRLTKVGLAKIAREQGNDKLTNALQDAMLELSKVENAEWSKEDEWKRKELIQYLKEKGDYRTTWMTWLKCLPERFNLQPKQEWSEEDKETLEKMHRLLIICRGEKKFIQEADYNKMDNLLKSLRPQPQKLEDWTEEDERLLGDVLGCITLVKTYKACGYLEDFKTEYTGEELRSFVRSLKSRPRKQPHWKPSKEQINALEHFIKSWGESGTMNPQNTILCAAKSLLIDLQKLLQP